MSKLLIIDSHALIHRAYHALPKLTSPQGELVQGVYGFCSVMLKTLKVIKPDYVVAAFDLPGPTFRHKTFKDYKATRIKAPQELYDQISSVKNFLKSANIKTIEQEGFEADDIIGSLVEKFQNSKNIEIIILTGDLDTLQLVKKNVKVQTFKKGINDAISYDELEVSKRFEGLRPSELIDYKGLRGDPSDNIPGVKGIGEKSAIKLIGVFKNLEILYKILHQDKGEFLEKSGLKERHFNILKDQEKQAFFSRELSTIRKDLTIKEDLIDLSFKNFDITSVKNFFYKLGFSSLIARLNNFLDPDKIESFEVPASKIYELSSDIGFKKFKKAVLKTKLFYCELAKNNFHFLLKNKSDIFKCTEDFLLKNKFAQDLFCDKSIKKIAYNLQEIFYFFLKNLNLNIRGAIFDFKIAGYLLNPGYKDYSIDKLKFTYLSQTQISQFKLNNSGVSYIDQNLFKLKEVLEKKLKEFKILKLFDELELPLIEVLAYLKCNGFKVNKNYLKDLLFDTKKHLGLLKKEIDDISKNPSINLNSPQQVSSLLFEKLKIPTDTIKRTKEGLISTSSKQLLKIRKDFKIVDLILKYRELDKLYNTYLAPIADLIDENDLKIHPTFNQTSTATGRLSCEGPNMQALPQKSDIQIKIRKAFIAEEGFRVVSFDYSQVELRIVAILSQEHKLIDFFRQNKDVHKLTASLIFNKNEDSISDKERQIAKTINFGIIYGLSPFGLAGALSISYQDAKNFIDTYFKEYPAIRKFIDKTIEETKKIGYNKTIFGRIRVIPEINSLNEFISNQGKRMAINFPVQGSQADIIKKAMLEAYELINKKYKGQAKMILQIHDELVFEVKKEILDVFIKEIKDIMENIVMLAAPLKVDASYGNNFGELNHYNKGTLF